MSQDIRIVGIGASAGGLEALEEFFKALPPDSGLGYVVIQHLSPDYKSLMVELLSKYTQMDVCRAEDGMEVEPNHVYLITPRKNLIIFQGKLYLTEQLHDHGLNLPIDIFLRSLAEDQAEKAIAVILSGTGSDGTLGIRAVKGNGGLVLVQDSQSAKFDGMPNSANATGLVDYVLPPHKISQEILRFVKHPIIEQSGKSDPPRKQQSSVSRILAILRNQIGIDFSAYKENTIIRRVERRIGINRLDTLEDYASLLSASAQEANILYKDLLIGVTRFFRDREHFDVIQQQVLPKLFDQHKSGGQIRIWCLGCSTGEEAYSLAMLFHQEQEKRGSNIDIKIFATDIDRESIEYAGTGVYPESIVADIDPELLHLYFVKKDTTFQIKPMIRKMVIFANHNVLKDPPFSAIDMLSCRNMLIYLKQEKQQRVLHALHFSLRKGGYLFLGASESVGELSTVFQTIDAKAKVFRCKQGMKYPRLSEFFDSPGKHHPLPARGRNPEKIHLDGRGDGSMIDAAYAILLGEFAPASVIINENLDLVHICREAEPFIKMPTGRASLNLLDLVPSGIKAAVSTAVHKAIKQNQPLTYFDLMMLQGEEGTLIDLSVRPIQDDHGKSLNYFLVLFIPRSEEVKPRPRDGETENRIGHQTRIIADLEQELQYTKENLQATIEELETSNEELQATNEELIASNEELQSTNEELQSVNEELYTVNSEYQKKIEELSELNNDMNNFLKNTDIGIIFLDRSLKIRKYTPAAKDAINIMEMDIGRPIEHLTRNIIHDPFMEDIRQVLRTLVPRETELKTTGGDWLLMRILPYRTTNNVVEGLVITFLDINTRKVSESRLQRERNLLLRVLENSPVAKTMVDEQGRIVYANEKTEELFELPRDEIYERSYQDHAWEILDEAGKEIPPDNLPFRRIQITGKPLTAYTHSILVNREEGRRKMLKISGSPIFDEKGTVQGAVFAMEEVEKEQCND